MVWKFSYDYCIKVINNDKQISIRDITGEDLELVGYILNESTDHMSAVLLMCELLKSKIYCGLNKNPLDIMKFPLSLVVYVTKLYTTEIISKEYIDKIIWLKLCYYMQKSSFRDLAQLEKIPMNKFMAMLTIHKEAVAHAKESQ